MRFVWAVAAFVLAALMIGAGIAQRTIFQGPTQQTSAISVTDDVPYVLVDGAVLGSVPGSQTLRAQQDGTIFAAYGRTVDLQAWLSATPYEHVVLDDDGAIATEVVEPEAAPADPAASGDATTEGDATAEGDAATDPETAALSPIGSDLWLDEFQQDDLLIATVNLPEDMSVLVASDGIEPAPAEIAITWPILNATPWAGPLIVGGGIMMAVGVVLYILGIRHVRRSRGPRRKGLPMPVTEPIDLSVDSVDKGVVSASPSRRALSGKRRAFTVLPVVAISAVLLSGCSADAWPQFTTSSTPSPSATVISPEGQQAPAVTQAQAERILQRIADQVAAADEARDPDAAGTRLMGAALAERLTNYTLRGAIADEAPLSAIPAKPVSLLLPQAYDGWPRTFMAVVEDDADKSATIMLATQQDAWSEYKLSYLANLEASTEMPTLAPAYVGASQVPPESAFLLLAPEKLAQAYADVLNKGDDSEFAALFDEGSDQFRVGVAADRQARLDTFNETGAQTGTLTFDSVAGQQAPVAMQTLESGAIVAVNVNETETVKPTNADAVIKLDNNPTVSTLAGAAQSATGFTTTFADQIFFYVPAQGSSERIRLLGYSSNILEAKVIP